MSDPILSNPTATIVHQIHAINSDNYPHSTAQVTTTPPEPQIELANLDLLLSAIEPHPTLTTPFIIYPLEASAEPGVQLALHYAGNRPAPGVRVFVAVVTSRCSLPVTDVHARFAVNKVCSELAL